MTRREPSLMPWKLYVNSQDFETFVSHELWVGEVVFEANALCTVVSMEWEQYLGSWINVSDFSLFWKSRERECKRGSKLSLSFGHETKNFHLGFPEKTIVLFLGIITANKCDRTETWFRFCVSTIARCVVCTDHVTTRSSKIKIIIARGEKERLSSGWSEDWKRSIAFFSKFPSPKQFYILM